jgi:hypothetical protein
MPAAVSAYAGLRWVPPDATYAVATRRTEDALTLTHHLLDAVGIVGQFDTAEVSRDLSRELGVDLLSADALADLGVDLKRGAAVWSRGLGPHLALPLADPQRFAAELERRRNAGTVVQVSRAHDVDVYTYRPPREAALHWAVAGDWFLAHLEVMEEREPDGAWFEAAWSARGALAGHDDFIAALDEATRRVGAEPALVGLARVPALLRHPLIAPAMAAEAPGCAPLVESLGRVFISAAGTEADVVGAVVVEVGAAIDPIRRLVLPVPAGWAKAREGAPLQLDVGVDLHAISAGLARCTREDLARDLRDVRGGRVLVHAIDLGRMTGKGAAVAELVDPRFLQRTIDDMIGDIPGIGFLTKRRKIGGLDVTVIDVPSFPAFAYGTSGTTGFGGVGGTLDAVLAGGIVPGGDELAHAAILPRVWSEATWDQLLREVIGRDEARAATIRRLRAWSLGELTVTAEGRALALTAHGAR